jgi:hypothetical protein
MPIGDLYDATQIIGKTLVAATDVPVYSLPPSANQNAVQIGIVKQGNPVGVVYSYLDADPSQNLTTLWWQFYPASNWSGYFYAPHQSGLYDVAALQQQGVLSLTEQAKQQEEANKPWYEKILDQALPVIALTILGAVAIGAYIKRK